DRESLGMVILHLTAFDPGPRGGNRGAGRRCRRVTAQARGWGEGFVESHSRPRRRARPTGFLVFRATGDHNAHQRVPRMTTGVAILGSTGSIGRSTLEVLSRQRDRFHLVALTAHSNAEL